MRKTFITIISLFILNGAVAQSVSTYTTTESVAWKKGKTALSAKPAANVVAEASEHGVPFVALAQHLMNWTGMRSICWRVPNRMN